MPIVVATLFDSSHTSHTHTLPISTALCACQLDISATAIAATASDAAVASSGGFFEEDLEVRKHATNGKGGKETVRETWTVETKWRNSVRV